MGSVQVEPGREQAAGRLGLLAQLLTDAIGGLDRPGGAAAVLDCGGGSGALAVPLAAAGHHVTVVDISADALATLRRRAEEAGVSRSVQALNGDVEALADLVPPACFDVALAHGILDVVDAVGPTFAAIVATVRPGGLVSVVVANPVASVLARALAGEPVLALQEFRALDDPDAAGTRVGPAAVVRLARRHGLQLDSRRGIGVFSDLVPGSALERPDTRRALRELDAGAADRHPFADLAGRIHLVLRRPAPAG